MKNVFVRLLIAGFITSGILISCNTSESNNKEQRVETANVTGGGQASVEDSESQNNVVQIAVSSPDHTTLVAAIKAASLVDALTNPGPFTVFAPTNAAFENLPAGTVNNLLKPDQKGALQNVLQYHVYVGVLPTDYMDEGQVLGQVNGGKVTIGYEDGTYTVNGAKILASIPASNGLVHVIDGVLLQK